MMNFIFPDSGQAQIFGKDVVKDSVAIRKEIGYLPSEVYYYDTIRVEELLEYSAKLKGVKDLSYVKELVSAFDLDVKKKFGQLSFGNKKKVGVIQALMHKPKLLILDEPTNGLDPLVQKTLMEMLREANKNGSTIFFSSHTLSVVQKMCNKIGIIKDGRILEVETFETIKDKRIKKVSMEIERLPDFIKSSDMVENLIVKDHLAEFYFRGQVNTLFDALKDTEIKDFSMQEPELEELFMHFYMEKGGQDES
jgi:ABC-2 type transport system ATP-binding protein